MSLDFLSNLNRVIQQVSKDKGVSQEVVVDSVVQGVLSAVRKKYGTYRDIEVKYNEDLGDLELFEFKKVVSDKEFEDELIEIKYSAAKELDPKIQKGDQIGTRLELKDLGRIDAQAAKQIIIQNLRSIEYEIIFNEFEKRKGEIASGIVRRVDPGIIVVDLEKTEAYIPRKEQIPGEQYKSGDRIQGYILEVRQTTRGPQIIMSRAHEQYLIKLFESEVPEVHEGIVKIVSAAREPGQRAKMSVYSTDPAVHPVGSCVGIKGSRVQSITQELKGERVDVIVWEDDPIQYICNALAPAKILKILMDEDQKQMQIIVPDDQLSLAIGKKGQNVRLAVKLTGWNLNLVSEQESKQSKKEALFNLSLLPDMSGTKAQSLFQYGYSNITQLSEADPSELKSIPEFEDETEAKKLIQSAQALIKKYADEGKELPKLKDTEKDKKPLASSLKEQAEEILKRELAQLEEGQSDETDKKQKTASADLDTKIEKDRASTEEKIEKNEEMGTKELKEEGQSDETDKKQKTASADLDTKIEKDRASTEEKIEKNEEMGTKELKEGGQSDETDKKQKTASADLDTKIEKDRASTEEKIEKNEEMGTKELKAVHGKPTPLKTSLKPEKKKSADKKRKQKKIKTSEKATSHSEKITKQETKPHFQKTKIHPADPDDMKNKKEPLAQKTGNKTEEQVQK